MSYEFLDHTADVAVELFADSREALFAEALRAFTDTVTDLDTVDPEEGHDLEVEAESLEELLVEWLGELVYRFDVDGLLFSDVKGVAIEETGVGYRLTGRALGEPYDEERHPLAVEVKGVTYHGLAVEGPGEGDEGDEDGWRGQVVFDV
jgi:SHS2 domain-containing protein